MYFACCVGESVGAEYDLGALLALLADVQDPREDVAVWLANKVVCVRHGDDRLTWLQPQHRPAEAAEAAEVADVAA